MSSRLLSSVAAISLTGRIFSREKAAELARTRVRRSDWTKFTYSLYLCTLYMVFSSASEIIIIKNTVPYDQVVRPEHIIRVIKLNEPQHAGSSRRDE